MSFLPLQRAWIWISVLASLAGWVLSAVGQLNRLGYVIFCGATAAVWWAVRKWGKRDPTAGSTKSWRARGRRVIGWPKVRWRFRHWLPASFASLALLVFLGGAIYAPNNHTALTYRTPRVLHWLAEGHWYWIYTPNYRMNDRACGFEWMTAPVLLFTRTDRLLFLINFITFLLLPGLTYSVLTRLGVRGRAAWNWMWLLPTGYTFLLQAGSLANDTFPTVYALAALDFGLRAWGSRRVSDLWLSILSAALLVGAKASNLPLLLPWAIVIFALLPMLLRRPATTLILVLVSATVSFLPTAALNIHYCGDWSGLNLERTGMDMKNPIVGIWGNCLLLMKNFVPPFFPQASWWNASALKILPQAIVGPMVANFEQGFQVIGEMPIEDGAGIGFGLSVLLLVSVMAGLWRKPKRDSVAGAVGISRMMVAMPGVLRWCVVVSPWVSLLAYCVKSGIVDAQRLISPYYPLLLPLLLVGVRQAEIVRRRWWQVMAFGVVLIAFPVIILTPARPLWPAQTVLEKLHALRPGSRLIERALKVYSVYAERSDPLAKVRELLPAGVRIVGFMGTGDDIDISLWHPFGSRRVEHILLGDSREKIRERQIEYAVVGGFNLEEKGTTLEAWQKRTGAELVAKTTATLTVIQGPQAWYVVHIPQMDTHAH